MEAITPSMMAQNLPTIVIESPLRNQTLSQLTLEQAHQKIGEDVRKLHESNSYEYVRVHYGAKQQVEQDMNEQVHRNRMETLQKYIDLEYACTAKIQNAKTTQQLEQLNKLYIEKQSAIANPQTSFNYVTTFQPYIYIQAKPRRPLYAKLFQQFDRRGASNLKATIGYRPFITFLDKIQFNMQAPITSLNKKRKHYQFGINYYNQTDRLGSPATVFTGLSLNCSPLFNGIDQKSYRIQTGFQIGSNKLTLEGVKRYPRILNNTDRYVSMGYNLPSRKVSIKLDRTLKDTLQNGDITTGQLIQSKVQFTVPFLSQSTFAKAQYSYRRFYDIFNLSTYFQNPQARSFFKNSNLQLNLGAKLLSMRKNYVSDFLQDSQMRGFDNDRKPRDSSLQLKSSLKLNTYNFPFLGSIGMVTFLYMQGGAQVSPRGSPYWMGASGMGISYALSKHINIELLYNLVQGQSQARKERVNFQIRMGLFD